MPDYQGTTTYTPPNAQRQSPFVGVSEVEKLVAELSAAAGMLADKLCGSVPEAGEANGLKAVPSGVFGELEMSTDRMRERAITGLNALRRIERHLP